MSTVIFLVRHAVHDRLGKLLCGRMPGVGLGSAGRQQADGLAARLGRETLAAVYSSPMQRAQETAQPIAVAQQQAVTTLDDMNEIDFGSWAGATFDALQPLPDWQAWNARRLHARPPDGEAMVDVQARVARCLEALRLRHPHQRIAVVSHGDVIKAAIAHALGLPLDFIQRFEVDPASLSTLVVGDWGMKLHALNEVA